MPNIRDLRGIHAGREAIIFANGPSLRQHSLQTIPEDVVRYGVNQSWRVSPAEYHVCCEMLHAQRDPDVYRTLADDGKLITVGAWWDGQRQYPTWCNVPIRDGIPWSHDLQQGVVVSHWTTGTVTLAAMQIAWWMGSNRIYLVGLDLTGPKFTGQATGKLDQQIKVFELAYPEMRSAGVEPIAIEPSLAPFPKAPWPWPETRGLTSPENLA